MATKNNTYIPTHIWVDSRVEGIGMSWYRGGHDEMTPEQLQPLLDEKNACAYYEGMFYDRVKDIPFKPRIIPVETYGMPTNMSIRENPTVTVVPKGTVLKETYPYGSKRFIFPR